MLEVPGKRADDRDMERIARSRCHFHEDSLQAFYLGNDRQSMEAHEQPVQRHPNSLRQKSTSNTGRSDYRHSSDCLSYNP